MRPQSLLALKIAAAAAILLWYGFFAAQKIDLSVADLGRHLKNGELLLESGRRSAVLRTNFYSYTETNFPFVNHHWLSGVAFFLIRNISGFGGLSVFALAAALATLGLMLWIAAKEAGMKITALVAIPLVPLIAERTEIRPELFTYLLSALFFWMLWRWRAREIGTRWLLALPALTVFWVNLHIGFLFGLFFIGSFLLEALLQKRPSDARALARALLLSAAATLANPAFWRGAAYPFFIFQNYGYRIVENQNVWFLERLGVIHDPNFLLFKIVLAAFVLSFAALAAANRRKISPAYLAIGAAFGTLAALAIRNFTPFGFAALPILAANIRHALAQRQWLERPAANAALAAALALSVLGTMALERNTIVQKSERFGFGLMPDETLAADFFRREGLRGPVFNNYDIGGYLIHYLFPGERVFVDNRPEAYPASFFDDEYIPIQQNESAWERAAARYGFNAIFFSHRDYTPWGQQFLAARIADPLWAPVYADRYSIIFLKRNRENQSAISRFEVPRSRFGIEQP